MSSTLEEKSINDIIPKLSGDDLAKFMSSKEEALAPALTYLSQVEYVQCAKVENETRVFFRIPEEKDMKFVTYSSPFFKSFVQSIAPYVRSLDIKDDVEPWLQKALLTKDLQSLKLGIVLSDELKNSIREHLKFDAMRYYSFKDFLANNLNLEGCKTVKIDYFDLDTTVSIVDCVNRQSKIDEVARLVTAFTPISIDTLAVGPPEHLPIDDPRDEYFKAYPRFSYYFPLALSENNDFYQFLHQKLPALKYLSMDIPGDCEKWEIFKSFYNFDEVMRYCRPFRKLRRNLKGYISWNVLVRPDEFLSWFPKEDDDTDSNDSLNERFEAEDHEDIYEIINQALIDRRFPDDFDPKFSKSYGSDIGIHEGFSFRVTFNCRWNHFNFEEYEEAYKKFLEERK